MTPQDPTARRAGPLLDVRRSHERFRTGLDWLDTRNSFSFGHHYDPDNTHHGVLMAFNDDTISPQAGFDTHPHRDMEIVTWVLGGSLVHQDSMGNSGIVYPGLAQRTGAGTGILHSEKNDSWRLDGVAGPPAARHDEPVRVIQSWILPDAPGLAPEYEQLEVGDELDGGSLVTVASGIPSHAGRAAIRIRNTHSAMHVARPLPGARAVTLPDAPLLHVFVARGTVELEGAGTLYEGDAVRIARGGGQRISATARDRATADATPAGAPGAPGAEVIVWEMHAGLGGPL